MRRSLFQSVKRKEDYRTVIVGCVMFQFALRCISDLFRMIEGYLRHIEGSFGAFVFFVSSSMWTDAACNGRNPQRCSCTVTGMSDMTMTRSTRHAQWVVAGNSKSHKSQGRHWDLSIEDLKTTFWQSSALFHMKVKFASHARSYNQCQTAPIRRSIPINVDVTCLSSMHSLGTQAPFLSWDDSDESCLSRILDSC